jgi:hypothetical protein
MLKPGKLFEIYLILWNKSFTVPISQAQERTEASTDVKVLSVRKFK